MGHFFSTVINIFGFSIRGTKEEQKILCAFDQVLETRLPLLTYEQVNPTKLGINEKPILVKIAPLKKSTRRVEQVLARSLINNYYSTNELCEISPVLGLCSKRYGVMNDYL